MTTSPQTAGVRLPAHLPHPFSPAGRADPGARLPLAAGPRPGALRPVLPHVVAHQPRRLRGRAARGRALGRSRAAGAGQERRAAAVHADHRPARAPTPAGAWAVAARARRDPCPGRRPGRGRGRPGGRARAPGGRRRGCGGAVRPRPCSGGSSSCPAPTGRPSPRWPAPRRSTSIRWPGPPWRWRAGPRWASSAASSPPAPSTVTEGPLARLGADTRLTERERTGILGLCRRRRLAAPGQGHRRRPVLAAARPDAVALLREGRRDDASSRPGAAAPRGAVPFTARVAPHRWRCPAGPCCRGGRVLIIIGAANRDPAVFERPRRAGARPGRQPPARVRRRNPLLSGGPTGALCLELLLTRLVRRHPSLSLAQPSGELDWDPRPLPRRLLGCPVTTGSADVH